MSPEPSKRGIKRHFSNAIDKLAHPTHTGSGRDSRVAASVDNDERIFMLGLNAKQKVILENGIKKKTAEGYSTR